MDNVKAKLGDSIAFASSMMEAVGKAPYNWPHKIHIKIRLDFPILQRQVNGQPLVYLDNAATSQKD